MPDILDEAAGAEPAEFVTLDHIIPDGLEVGDIVFIKGDPYAFLFKADGPSPLVFKPELRGRMLEVMPTEFIRLISSGEAVRPGRKPGSCQAPSPALPVLQDQALPRGVRATRDLKDHYVVEFRDRIEQAAERGETYARNRRNARDVIDTVDGVLRAKKIAPPENRGWRSVLRWLSKAIASDGSPLANVHGNALREYARKIPQRVLDIIAVEIRRSVEISAHLGPKKIGVLVNDEIKRIKREEGTSLPLVKPSLMTTEYSRFDPWIRMAKAEGVHAADLEYGSVGKLLRPTKINQLWELDHHVVDLVALLGDTPMGRAISKSGLGRFGITVAYDVYSGYPVGFYPSFDGTGLLPALMCIAHGVQPKTYVATRFPHIQGAFLAYGKPLKIRYDRGMEFVGRQMAAALARLGIGFELARPRCPDDKPYVERFFGTFESSFINWLKGRTGSNPRKRGASDPMKEVALELDDIVALIHEFIITVHARQKQQGLDWESPEERWLRGQREKSPNVLSPDEQARIDVIASIEVNVNGTREGIRWRNKFYQSRELQAIRRASGDHGFRKKNMTPLVGRVSLRDVGTMYVSVPGAKPPREIAVPCTKPAAHGRTLWQDEMIEALLRQKKKDPTSALDYGDGFAALFKRSLNYMGYSPDAKPRPGPARSSAVAARFAGVMVDGVSEHPLARLERDAEALDIFKQVEETVRGRGSDRPSKVVRETTAFGVDELLADEIDLDELFDGEDG